MKKPITLRGTIAVSSKSFVWEDFTGSVIHVGQGLGCMQWWELISLFSCLCLESENHDFSLWLTAGECSYWPQVWSLWVTGKAAHPHRESQQGYPGLVLWFVGLASPFLPHRMPPPLRAAAWEVTVIALSFTRTCRALGLLSLWSTHTPIHTPPLNTSTNTPEQMLEQSLPWLPGGTSEGS